MKPGCDESIVVILPRKGANDPLLLKDYKLGFNEEVYVCACTCTCSQEVFLFSNGPSQDLGKKFS